MSKERTIPNPESALLQHAIIGGAGLRLPPDLEAPPGMAMVLLYVPAQELTSRSMPDVQADLGLPWAADDGTCVWLDELTS